MFNAINLVHAVDYLETFCQERNYPRPQFRMVKKQKIGHRTYYTVQVIIDELVLMYGRGISRRLARMMAAQNLLKNLEQFERTMMPFYYETPIIVDHDN